MKEITPLAAYPSPTHQEAAESATAFFSGHPDVDAVLLTCSCARGKATKDSCVDIAVLLPEDLADGKKDRLSSAWDSYYQREAVFRDSVYIRLIEKKRRKFPRIYWEGEQSAPPSKEGEGEIHPPLASLGRGKPRPFYFERGSAHLKIKRGGWGG